MHESASLVIHLQWRVGPFPLKAPESRHGCGRPQQNVSLLLSKGSIIAYLFWQSASSGCSLGASS